MSGCSRGHRRVPVAPCPSWENLPLSAEPAKVTSARINLINKTVHHGGHYLLIGDDRAGRPVPERQRLPGPCSPSGAWGALGLGSCLQPLACTGLPRRRPSHRLQPAGHSLPPPAALLCPAHLASLPPELASPTLPQESWGRGRGLWAWRRPQLHPSGQSRPSPHPGSKAAPLGTGSWSPGRWARADTVRDPRDRPSSAGGEPGPGSACPVRAGAAPVPPGPGGCARGVLPAQRSFPSGSGCLDQGRLTGVHTRVSAHA